MGPRQRAETTPPESAALLRTHVHQGETIATLTTKKPNRVTQIADERVFIETEWSAWKGRSELVPAWMLNEGWRTLQRDRVLRNAELIETVKRSSAVMALLAHLPGVAIQSVRPLILVLLPEDRR